MKDNAGVAWIYNRLEVEEIEIVSAIYNMEKTVQEPLKLWKNCRLNVCFFHQATMREEFYFFLPQQKL